MTLEKVTGSTIFKAISFELPIGDTTERDKQWVSVESLQNATLEELARYSYQVNLAYNREIELAVKKREWAQQLEELAKGLNPNEKWIGTTQEQRVRNVFLGLKKIIREMKK